MVRLALRDVLKELIELAAQMDGGSGKQRQSEESSIIYENWDEGQTAEQNQRRAG